MSDAVSALEGARFEGLATVEDIGLQGMITLRGDLALAAVKKAASAAAGAPLPARLEAVMSDTGGLCWMSPDELLVLCPYDEVQARLAKLTMALTKTHALAVDMSDARASFRLSGPGAREAMAKLCPVDLSPDAFRPGMFRRTRMGQIPAAFWLEDEDSFRIICFRSVAQYAYDLLKTAAARDAAVGYF